MANVTPKSPSEGLRTALKNHSAVLATIIKGLKEFNPLATDSLPDLIDKFTELKDSLSSKLTDLTVSLQHQTDTATVAMSNPASVSTGIKMIAGPIYVLIKEVTIAYNLVKTVAAIIVQYVTIFGLVIEKITEATLVVVSLGLNFVKNALSTLLADMYIFLASIKQKAVDYVKDQMRTTMVTTWEKDRATITEQLKITTDPTEQEVLKSKIRSITASIEWTNSALKSFQPALTVGA